MPNSDALKTWLSKGNLFEVLLALRNTKNNDLQNEVIQLIARYHEYQRLQRLRLSSTSESTTELARINEAAIKIIDLYVQEGIDQFPNPQDFQQKTTTRRRSPQLVNWGILIVLSVVLLIAINVWIDYEYPVQIKREQVKKDDSTTTPPKPKLQEKPNIQLKKRTFSIVVQDSASDEYVDSAVVLAEGIQKTTHNGRAEFELPVGKKNKTITIQVKKEGFKTTEVSLEPFEEEKAIKIAKYENH